MTTTIRRRTTAHRRQLAEFLRACRARLTPAEVGLPSGGARRTPGLRREEVAILAGVGVTWYTRLEQGADINPSDEVLVAIASTLRLSDAESAHLLDLSRGALVLNGGATSVEVPPDLHALLDQQDPAPALLMDRRWDVLAWNHGAEAVYGWSGQAASERNLAWLLFGGAKDCGSLVDWPSHARRVAGELYANSPQMLADKRFAAVVGRLRRDHPEFEGWWSAHEVRPRTGVPKDLNHPRVGPLLLQEVILQPANAAELQMLVLLPRPGTGTLEKLRSLIADAQRLAESGSDVDVLGL